MSKIQDFITAKEKLSKVLLKTSLIQSPIFSKEAGNEVYIKPENLQKTGSFKIRGAYNKITNLSDEEKKKGLSRRRLREEAFKILFSMQFIKVNEEKVEIYCDINGIGNREDIAYLVNIVNIYNEKNEYLESIIEQNKKDTWDYSRIDKIAIALIKLSIIEIEFLGIPFKISINECINICKKYNEEKNTKFINGILANYVKIKGIDNGI